MFFSVTLTQEELLLTKLSQAYDFYQKNNWRWSFAEPFLNCLVLKGDQQLQNAMVLIGKGLTENNPNAHKAALLIERLYFEGLNDSSFKLAIKNCLTNIFFDETLNSLNERKTQLVDCLKMLYEAELEYLERHRAELG